jgi:flagellar export protein FliJ
MAFRYTLQLLLRVRQSLERQEEQRLYAAAAVVAQLRAKLEQLERDRLNAKRAVLQQMSEGTFGSTLQFVADCDAAAAFHCARLQAELVDAEHRRLEQLDVYRQARQKREIFEGLRDQQKAVYDQERARREQELADEAFLLRRHATPSE